MFVSLCLWLCTINQSIVLGKEIVAEYTVIIINRKEIHAMCTTALNRELKAEQVINNIETLSSSVIISDVVILDVTI